MNLNNQPTIDELAEMFAAQKDTLDDHILWVEKSGEVKIDCLAPHSEEADFDRSHRELAARLKMYRRGQGYVGKKAAADRNFIEQVFDTINNAWASFKDSSQVKVIDRYY
ncbi:hypothetical protein VRB67_08995 [Pseudomonas trivialis]|jgi:hypothetical protein|uniref:Uncharacterized protein n=1 Tax=Pseudomonas trivialis TaxID=200450 RepID=A0A0R2ZF37_9PSED|nr:MULTISPECIES: hypothetical protein [Pseudomonas]WQG58217.1 hypothetical protein RHM66_26510 [Pseudomonas sp. RTB3]KRP59129.1 hypothetical protein TU79_17055 [Pseudomonas trivialis]MBP1123909.1 hypothetical protein [Pseudomonas sp. PvP025]MDQ0397769.1 hypothetical protein [Pseudomonas sp. PvP006]MEB0109421.1 hypothetical protein [Pseudomonas sp. MH9.3]